MKVKKREVVSDVLFDSLRSAPRVYYRLIVSLEDANRGLWGSVRGIRDYGVQRGLHLFDG